MQAAPVALMTVCCNGNMHGRACKPTNRLIAHLCVSTWSTETQLVFLCASKTCAGALLHNSRRVCCWAQKRNPDGTLAIGSAPSALQADGAAAHKAARADAARAPALEGVGRPEPLLEKGPAQGSPCVDQAGKETEGKSAGASGPVAGPQGAPAEAPGTGGPVRWWKQGRASQQIGAVLATHVAQVRVAVTPETQSAATLEHGPGLGAAPVWRRFSASCFAACVRWWQRTYGTQQCI